MAAIIPFHLFCPSSLTWYIIRFSQCDITMNLQHCPYFCCNQNVFMIFFLKIMISVPCLINIWLKVCKQYLPKQLEYLPSTNAWSGPRIMRAFSQAYCINELCFYTLLDQLILFLIICPCSDSNVLRDLLSFFCAHSDVNKSFTTI